ncbi:MAG: hypothetical protein OQL06_02760 [Gammaproteobacteria bacterium]|nr:hypothetical protein [Gammaproteobacteria bacterium]
MSYLKASYTDHSSCCVEFIDGIQYLENRLIHEAVYSFKKACDSAGKHDLNLNKYKSYYGFSRFLKGDPDGLRLCRDVTVSACHDGDVFFNLARAEYFNENRKQMVLALIKGRQIDRQHEGLKLLQQQVGVRKRKPLPFLPRENMLSDMVGKCLRNTRR